MTQNAKQISIFVSFELKKVNEQKYQRTNGPVNAHLISWPTKAQNIQKTWKIYGKKTTLTFNTHIPSKTQLVVCIYQLSGHWLQ